MYWFTSLLAVVVALPLYPFSGFPVARKMSGGPLALVGMGIQSRGKEDAHVIDYEGGADQSQPRGDCPQEARDFCSRRIRSLRSASSSSSINSLLKRWSASSWARVRALRRRSAFSKLFSITVISSKSFPWSWPRGVLPPPGPSLSTTSVYQKSFNSATVLFKCGTI